MSALNSFFRPAVAAALLIAPGIFSPLPSQAQAMASAPVDAKAVLPPDWEATPPIIFENLDQSQFSGIDLNSPPKLGQVFPLFTPAQVNGAYALGSSLPFSNKTGAGVTVAIVDAYGDTTASGSSIIDHAASDLAAFSAHFGLPYSSSQFSEAFPAGVPTTAAVGNWGVETALDIEWVHSIAPAAKILLVIAPNSGGSLYTGVQYGAAHSSVVSMSWEGGEFSGENTLDAPYFGAANVTYFAATGDGGAGVGYPGASPNVTAIGGTQLGITSPSSGVYNWLSEIGWSGSGGGVSSFEPHVGFQNGFVSNSQNRSTPDVSAIASGNSGVYIIQNGSLGGAAGTSLACPVWAGMAALVDGNVPTPVGESLWHTGLYAYGTSSNITANYHDITSGNNGTYSCGTGYDLVTGIGSPKGNVLLPNLVNFSTSTELAIRSFYFSPSTVSDKSTAPAYVVLNAPAPAGGVHVPVYYGSSLFYTVSIPAGSTTGSFGVTSSGPATYTFTARYNGSSASASVTFTPAVSSLTFNPAEPNYRATSLTTVTLDHAAPAGGAVISLGGVSISSITIPAGSTSGSFNLGTGSAGTYTISASYNGSSVTSHITFTPVVASFTFNPNPVSYHTHTLTTVTLSSGAPAGGATVNVTYNGNAFYTLTFPAGATSEAFYISSSGPATYTFNASYNGSSLNGVVTFTN